MTRIEVLSNSNSNRIFDLWRLVNFVVDLIQSSLHIVLVTTIRHLHSRDNTVRSLRVILAPFLPGSRNLLPSIDLYLVRMDFFSVLFGDGTTKVEADTQFLL